MKLSEAILKGCDISKPLSHGMALRRGEEVYACALGAAGVALEPRFPLLADEEQCDLITDWYDEALKAEVNCRSISSQIGHQLVPKHKKGLIPNLFFLITTLNDRRLMEREEIAKLIAEMGY